MKSLYYSYNFDIAQTFIIRIKGNSVSERMAKRCADSCESVGQPYQFWDAYDGTGGEIIKPSHHNVIADIVKITDHYATRSEVATALSHISLWTHCAQIDRPIVVLEHDAIMLKKYDRHFLYNSIGYLGCKEQHVNGWAVAAVPPHASEGPNYHFICRAHAYSIDPVVAKNLISHVIKLGIFAPLDIMVRADIFPFHQNGLYAYDNPDFENTTISNRPKNGRTTQRNDKLEW